MKRWPLIGILLFAATLAPAQEGTEEPPRKSIRPDYTIGLEDVLHVSVWGETGLDLVVRVRPDGKITVPLVNDLYVEGLSAEQVRQLLEERLRQYIRDPNVTVIVDEINSFRVYVLGEVNQQGVLHFNQPTKLLQAIAAAGGLTQFSKKEIVVLREQDGVEHRIKVDYKALVSGELNQSDLYIRPGDIVVVN